MNWIKDKLKKFWKWLTIIFIGGISIFSYVNLPPQQGIKVPKLELRDKTVSMNWSDDNSNENIIIRTDKKDYIGNEDIYFSIENTTNQSVNINSVFTFDGNRKINLVSVMRYEGIEMTAASISAGTIHEKWQPLTISEPKISEINSDILKTKKVRKLTKGNFTNEFLDSIAANTTVYYKARLFVPRRIPQTEFYIEAFGNNIYGHLDPTLIAHGNAQIDTGINDGFGVNTQGVGLFDGTGDFVVASDSADWTMFAGNFTIEFWVNVHSIGNAAEEAFISQDDGTSMWRISLYHLNAGPYNELYLYDYESGYKTQIGTTAWNPTFDTWYHIAIVNDQTGGAQYIFVNGISQTLATDINSGSGNIAGQLYIGSLGTRGTQDFNGWLDEVRITKGTALYTTNFTPARLAGGGNTKLLLCMNGTDGSTTFTDSSAGTCVVASPTPTPGGTYRRRITED